MVLRGGSHGRYATRFRANRLAASRHETLEGSLQHFAKGWRVGSRFQFCYRNTVVRQDMAAFMHQLYEYLK